MTFRSEPVRHACKSCGHAEDDGKWFARCRACREWSAPVARATPASVSRPDDLAVARAARVVPAQPGPVLVADAMPVVHEVPVPITSVSEEQCARFPCGIEPVDRVLGGGFVPASGVIIGGEPGSGKCLGKGTPVMMYDGEVVPVESIKVGDRLMGPDGKARRVSSTNQGTGKLFKITPTKGEPWVCNDEHMMTLVESGSDDVFDMPLDQLLKSTAELRHHAKLFTARIDSFNGFDKPLPVDPYFLGLWFGDGTKEIKNLARSGRALSKIQITKWDDEVRQCCKQVALTWGLFVNEFPNSSGCPSFSITAKRKDKKDNPLLRTMRELLGSDLKVPAIYMKAPRDQRLQFLAGLIDSDGDLSKNCFTVTQKRQDWARAIWWLARSVGLCAVIHAKAGGCTRSDGTRFEGMYWRVSISGDTDMVPTRISRKQATPREQKKVATRTGFTADPIGRGRFYGFTLSGDGRFLLGDFTVTHNSTLIAQALAGINLPVLYATAEETVGQVAARAKRINAAHDRIMLIREPNVDRIIMHAKELRAAGPLVLLVDSINTLYTDDINSPPNSLAQVRECAARVCAFGKNFDVIHIIVAQVNKEGNIAGPKTVEHLVDVVLSLELGSEAEGLQHIRFLNAHKNRHGDTQSAGAFEMKQEGMVPCTAEARENAAERDAVYLPLAQELLTRYRALGGTFEGGLRERIGDLLDLDAQLSRGPQPQRSTRALDSNDEMLGISKDPKREE